jgi:hypothetical protein
MACRLAHDTSRAQGHAVLTVVVVLCVWCWRMVLLSPKSASLP